jgi:alginate O-acetyltransferase complex protein AlgI
VLFIEFRFLVLFLTAFAVHWSMPWPRARKLWLLACSNVFYGAWDARFLVLIWFSTILDWIVALGLERTQSPRRRRALLLTSFAGSLGMLGVFKYYDFFALSAQKLGASLGVQLSVPLLSVILPVGISFYTFQTMSYVIDVYRKELKAERSLWDFALFVMFFPQLVAGPIVRASDFLPQLRATPVFRSVDVRGCLVLFLWGFAKKACIADNLAPWVDRVFASPEQYGGISCWTAICAYSAQIYCDFSGYSDMAIATAGLLGYRLCENFRHPYVATDVRDFWRRWHISLSTWLRDYLYIPLGGGRGTKLRTGFNLMVTMLLGGLWHGASWTFVVWGAMHGAALWAQRIWSEGRPAAPPGGPRLLGTWLATQAWVGLAWIFFRAATFEGAWSVLRGALFLRPTGTEQLPAALIVVLALLLAIQWREDRRGEARWWRSLPGPIFSAGFGACSAVVLMFVQLDYLPFLYFQF